MQDVKDGIILEGNITIAVLTHRVLHDVAVKIGAEFDGWGYPMWTKECIVDGFGMTGPDVTDLHRGNPYGMGMWLTDKNPGDRAWVSFDLKEIVSLDEMWIWNYNCFDETHDRNIYGEGTPCGFRDVKIEHSLDGDKWQEFKGSGYPYRLAKADGTPFIKATNLDDGMNSPVRFNGITTRYIKLSAESHVGQGNWGGQRYGLSEVRFTVN